MPPVSWFRRILALVLLAVWLPATSHCALETVLGWVGDEHCLSACPHDATAKAGPPASDVCSMLEDGAIKPVLDPLIAPAPSLTVLACLACVHATLLAEARPLEPPAWSGGHPADWVPMRHIAVRAVAPARAPGQV